MDLTVMDELVVFSWILLSFKAILSHGVICAANNYTCNGKCCNSYPDVSDKAVVTSWYIWVAVFCGLMLLGTISGIHLRLKHSKSRVAFVPSHNQGGPMVQSRHPVRPTFIQPSPYMNPAGQRGPQFYRPAMMPLRPPPYSPAQAPPPPYQMQGPPRPQNPPRLSPMGARRQEKDESMALSMIQPMQPAYIMPDAYGPLLNPPYTHPPPTSAAPPGRVQVMETNHM